MEQDISNFLTNLYLLQTLFEKIDSSNDCYELRETFQELKIQTSNLEKKISSNLVLLKKEGISENTLLENPLIFQYTRAIEVWKVLSSESTKKLDASQLEISLSESSQLQSLQTENFVSKAEILRKIKEERSKEIKKIKEDFEEVQQLTVATAYLISQQGIKLNQCEETIQLTEEETERGVQEIIKAAKEQTERWNLTTVAMGIVVGGCFGLLLGPLGVLLGGASGGTVGAYVSGKVNEFKKESFDKELVRQNLKEKWVPDDHAIHCRQCKRLFSPWRRIHHCRKCGGVFCYLCSGQQASIKIPNVDQERMERVCDGCYQEIWSKK